ncbi:hypothetical protein BAUCODRAFT_512537 [Baudoinia panamericana UAMH 10762]|uniref:Uncharacterized protein n=1 Tax=Baudoinia panamericana (strain UAMH 10762) TaxID=717646 RepID=M2MHA2_BAUPA|nr:uncharacterized protein BAUCODRAFT_512537 [Baudoinia panamericana UAMH 10762]EMC95981.1 hypothetical protein BAUCODRAFT_512537 [Baudoinia panamericana UAMH 10762]
MPVTVIGELTALSTALQASLRVTEKIFEVIAVDQEARDILEITSRMTTRLAQAKTLLHQKSHLLSSIEKSLVEDALQPAERAIASVAKLVEAARADLEVSGGKKAGRVSLRTRLQFVFQDSARLPVSLQKLEFANSNLNAAIGLLSGKEGSRYILPEIVAISQNGPPPAYDETDFLHKSRLRNSRLRQRASMASFSSTTMSETTAPAEGYSETPSLFAGSPVDACSTLEHPPTSLFDPPLRTDKPREMLLLAVPPEEPSTGPLLRGKARNQAWLQRQAEG